MIGFTKLLCGTATVSQALRQAQGDEPRDPALLQFTTDNRPLVVWNATLRCNLRCRHCYNDSGCPAEGELTTAEAEALIDDLAGLGAPVLLFSGGEPLLRQDLYHLASYAAARGVRPVLSTNGTLITAKVAQELARAGLQYVGISIDGLPSTHNRLRGCPEAAERAWAGLRAAREQGLRTGVRFTVHQENLDDLPGVLEQAVEDRVQRFCLYHLVYAGRGTALADADLTHTQRRYMITWLIEKTEELHRHGQEIEILTTDNHADGVFLYQHIVKRDPERAEEVLRLLGMHGGCSAGRKFANVDAQGDVHACQFWGHQSLGNVRERPFSEIWGRPSHPLLCGLRESAARLHGRCADCAFTAYCGGCRIRAQAVCCDAWGADPACYLTDEEIADATRLLRGRRPG